MRKFLIGVMAAAVALSLGGIAQAADVPVKAGTPPPVTGPAVVYFGGGAIAPHSWFADVGAVWAFNRNLNVDGALFRIRGGTGEYEYLVAPGVENNVDFHLGEFMVGYQRFINGVRYSGYIGAQVQHHDNNTLVDPTGLNGTKWGVTAQGEIFAPFGSGYGLLLGQISSVYSTYFVMAKYGYNVSPTLSVGPEVAALGNKRFDAVRAGLFASLNLTPSAQFIISGGYSWGESNTLRNDDGGYATVHIRVLY